jgi:hypothetical protein
MPDLRINLLGEVKKDEAMKRAPMADLKLTLILVREGFKDEIEANGVRN